MATQCNQEAVLYFIKERGGRVKNVDLMDYFRATIPKDPALKQVAKEAFKRHVDRVAYVKEENGEKYVCLKRRFREWSRPADELADSRSGAPQGLLPGSGYGTDDAGGANSQPDISDKFSEGVNGGTEPDLRAHMGNSNGGRSAEHRLEAADPSTQMSEERTQNDTAVEDGKENRARCARLGRLSYSEDQDSISDTPKHNRKRVVEASADSSPQIRRSALPRNPADLPGRWKDCPRGESDYEAAAAATLEPLEHEWMMCASDGHWESLRRLLVREPALVARKDFVTGFTCLHWAAKLGKHELIVMVVNFAKEHQVSVNVNARSSAGYTPLHLAAMHNHLEVVKLLVGAFDADVEARDYNGKKACQYLKSDIAQNILDIVGACAEADDAGVGDAGRWRLSRVIQSNFRPLRAQNHDGSDEDGSTKQKSLRRKSSFTKMKPSLNKIRLRSQIVHSTSLFDRFEKDATEESPKLSRPKSNLFG